MRSSDRYTLTRLIASALAVTAALYALFFHFATRIWAARAEVPLAEITPWARWGMSESEGLDGAEPQVLLLLALAVPIVTWAVMRLLDRCPPRYANLVVPV